MAKKLKKPDAAAEGKPGLGKCAVCGDAITVNDGKDNHCRNGHVVAVNHADFKFGPVASTEIERINKETAAIKPVADAPTKTE